MEFNREFQFFDDFMLKASRYGEFNDPFDLVLGSYRASLSADEGKEFDDALPEYLSDPSYFINTYLDVDAGARASVVVICFTKTFNNLLMWAHYAKDHTGVCIGYDYNCDFFHNKYSCNYSNNVGKIRKVEYTKERPKYYDPSELVNNTSEWFKKSKDWNYEEEYRILLPIDDAVLKEKPGSTIFLYEIQPKHIKQVILGCRMEDDDKKQIYEKLTGYDIQIIEAKPDPAHYELIFADYV